MTRKAEWVKANGNAPVFSKDMRRSANAWPTLPPVHCWRAAVEIRLCGFGKVCRMSLYMHFVIHTKLTTVQPDSEFECMGVLMSHSQDVKCVAWHPTEEVGVALCLIHDLIISQCRS